MFKSSLHVYLVLLLIPFLSGCVGYNTITKSKPINSSSSFASKAPLKGWEDIPIYDDDELFPDARYRVVATVTVTGDQKSLDETLIQKMQQEASRYKADAVIFKNWKEVERNAVNGVAIGINIISLFSGDFVGLNMGGPYIAYEYEGIAIQFLK